MKLATVRPTTNIYGSEKDGRLIIVSADNSRGCLVPKWETMLSCMESWDLAEPELRQISSKLNNKSGESFSMDSVSLMAPFPRTWAWLDGSAFVQHVILVRKARGAEPPEDLLTVPLMYQGVSDNLMGPTDPIPLEDESYGMDFEGEIAIVTDTVPMGTKSENASAHIKLLLLMNDVSLRNLIPRELATGFGFFHGKPASSFAPFAVTPDELGDAWSGGRVHLALESSLNGAQFGHPNAGEMHFSFEQLIEHAAKTRSLSAGTILGSGTVSNKDETVGSSCLAEKRMLEKIHTGTSTTPFMKVGDFVELDMVRGGVSIFGKIAQKVVRYERRSA